LTGPGPAVRATGRDAGRKRAFAAGPAAPARSDESPAARLPRADPG